MKKNISLFISIALGIALSSASITTQEIKGTKSYSHTAVFSAKTQNTADESLTISSKAVKGSSSVKPDILSEGTLKISENLEAAPKASENSGQAVENSNTKDTESILPAAVTIKPKNPVLSRGGMAPVKASEYKKVSSIAADTSTENKSTTSKKVEMLDWWNSAGSVFSRGSEATVKDIYTGKTFKIKRTMGTNHADCEALTLKDTEIIKSIWGGFSWGVRPVHIYINGRILAASMSAMPHAGIDAAPAFETIDNRSVNYGRGQNLDVVKNNGMDGHFDIHFLNSTKHKDGQENPKHQAAVKIAASKN